MTSRLVIDEILDPSEARIVVTRDASGRVTDVRFDLVGLPRVDAMLVGRPLADVPGLVEHLCSICPASHHLAGVRAIEALWGGVRLTPAAVAQRRLLNDGSVLANHAMSWVIAATQAAQSPESATTAPDAPSLVDDAMALRRLAKAAMTAAGCPGHFPATAVPGGVASPVSPELRDRCAAMLDDALAAAMRIARSAVSDIDHTSAPDGADDFVGADVALVDADGHPDLSGDYLRAVAADGTVIVAGATSDAWDDLVAESVPGSQAPRPYLVALGPDLGGYRVGPVAQLRVGVLSTPMAAEFQRDWLRAAPRTQAARAITTLHLVEDIAGLLASPDLLGDDLMAPLPASPQGGTGVGWVDGSRGLLVHRYAASASGEVTSATILTPTAQNERWLAQLLRDAVEHSADMTGVAEEAIRQADPCLPCVTAPAGHMGLVIDTVTGEPKER